MIRERRVDVVDDWQRNHKCHWIFGLASRLFFAHPLVGQFNPSQLDVLELLVGGMTNEEISGELNMGFGTVKVHVAAILQGLGVPNRAGARKVGAQYLQARKEERPASSVALTLSILS
jgi:DNA-binding NarL/FixJ family response regulator